MLKDPRYNGVLATGISEGRLAPVSSAQMRFRCEVLDRGAKNHNANSICSLDMEFGRIRERACGYKNING
jgi:hypothetical protein